MKRFLMMIGAVMMVVPTMTAAELNINLAEYGMLCRPAIPVNDQDFEIEVKVGGNDPKREMLIELHQDGQEIATKKLALGESSAVFTCRTTSNGWKKFMATAIQGYDSCQETLSVPVVSRKLHFPWFGFYDEEGQLKNCKFPTMVLAGRTKGDIDYWKRRGVMPGCWRDGRRKGKTIEDYTAYFGDLAQNLGFGGIMIDEIGGYDNEEIKNRLIVQGLKAFCETNEELFVALWVPGVLREPLANITKNVYRKKGVDLLMLETYVNYLVCELGTYRPNESIRQRIDIARRQDVLSNSVITIGIKGIEKKYKLTKEEIEDQVRMIKRLGPEMPGLGIYGEGKNPPPPLVYFADSLCEKYYISPVLTTWSDKVWISNPVPVKGEKVLISGEIVNIGGMDSGRVWGHFYDGNPAYGGKLISKTEVAMVSSSAEGTVPGGVRVTAEWKPKKLGTHEIFFEIRPTNSEDTLLDHVGQRRVYVR